MYPVGFPVLQHFDSHVYFDFIFAEHISNWWKNVHVIYSTYIDDLDRKTR